MAMNRRDFGKVMLGVTGGLLAGAQIAYGAEEEGARSVQAADARLRRQECVQGAGRL